MNQSTTSKAAANVATQVGKTVTAAANDARNMAADAKTALANGAGAAVEAVKDAAADKAEAARDTLSDVGDRLAATLERASSDIGGDGDALTSRVLSSVSEGLTSATDALRQRSVGELTGDLRTLVRRHPGAFMALAAVAGFAAARFVRSSGARRLADEGEDRGRGSRA